MAAIDSICSHNHVTDGYGILIQLQAFGNRYSGAIFQINATTARAERVPYYRLYE